LADVLPDNTKPLVLRTQRQKHVNPASELHTNTRHWLWHRSNCTIGT